jgi:hypothetical protein
MRTEDDIRAAFRALAREAPDAGAVLTAVRKQLDKPSAGTRQGGPRAVRRRMAPLAAAAAVVAVTAAAVALANGQTSHRAPAISGSGLNRVPRYYMSLALTHKSKYRTTFSAVVKDTVTGATLVTVRPPDHFGTFAGVAGAADDRTFVLAAQKFPAQPGAGAAIKLYRAVFYPAKAAVTLTALPIPQIPAAESFDGLALSPSGASLAVGISTSPQQRGDGRQQLRVYSLPSGAVKVWQQSPGFGLQGQLSFAQSGVLAFNWAGQPAAGIWLLRTGTSGGDLTKHSQLAVGTVMGRYDVVGGVLSGDGSIITAVATIPAVGTGAVTAGRAGSNLSTVQAPGQAPGNSKIVQFSVQTGRAIRILWRSRYLASLLWSSSSGDVLIVQAPATRSGKRWIIGVLHGGHLTPIPGVPARISHPGQVVAGVPVPALAF